MAANSAATPAPHAQWHCSVGTTRVKCNWPALVHWSRHMRMHWSWLAGFPQVQLVTSPPTHSHAHTSTPVPAHSHTIPAWHCHSNTPHMHADTTTWLTRDVSFPTRATAWCTGSLHDSHGALVDWCRFVGVEAGGHVHGSSDGGKWARCCHRHSAGRAGQCTPPHCIECIECVECRNEASVAWYDQRVQCVRE